MNTELITEWVQAVGALDAYRDAHMERLTNSRGSVIWNALASFQRETYDQLEGVRYATWHRLIAEVHATEPKRGRLETLARRVVHASDQWWDTFCNDPDDPQLGALHTKREYAERQVIKAATRT